MQVPNINSIFKNLNERIMDNSVRSDLTKLDIDIKSNYFFFPFIIKTGLVNITDKGFQPNNGVPQNFTQMSQIFTGKEGIIAQWKNAIKIKSRAIPEIWNYDFLQNNKDWFTYSINEFKNSLTDKVSYLYITSTEKTYLWDATKQVFINSEEPENNYPVNDIWEKINNENGFNVYVMNLQKINKALDNFAIKRKFKGDAYKCHIVNINDTVEFSKLGGEEYFGEYNAWYLDRTITIETTYNFQREDFLRFYLVPLQSDKEDVDDNLLMFISNAQPKYNDLNELVYWVITFSYVKDYINTTGQTIQQFVQFSAPGEGYVIPKIIWDDLGIPKDYIINEKFTGDNGIKSIQLTLLGNNGFTAPVIFGRPIENLGKWNEKVYPQRRLFIDDLKMPVADSLTKSSKPLTTYLLTNGIPAINGQYDNWLKRKQGQTNQEVKKNYEGYLNTNRDLTKATNPNNLTIKDVALNYKGNGVINRDYDVRANGYFKYNFDIGNNKINPSKNRGQLKDMLNLFSVMVNHIISLPIDVTESIAWTQRDIPIVGKFLNAISLGIPIYWKEIDKNTNNLYPNINNGIPLFIGKANYTFYDESYWPIVGSGGTQAKNQGNIPLDAFRYNTQDEVNDIIGASASNTSWAFTLTDKIIASRWSKKTKQEDGKNYRISSVMIPEAFNSEDNIYLINDETTSLPTMESKNLLTDIVGSGRYIIDAVGFYNLGKTACRIYMFSDDIDLFDPYSIMSYFVSLQTTSLYNNSVRDWLTLYSLSYLDQYIDDDIVHEWPVKLPDPPPSINFYPVQIILNKADSKLDVSAKDNGRGGTKDQKNYSQDIILFDFGIFGATEWKQVQNNYDSFTFENDGKITFEANSIDPEFNWTKKLETRINIKIENINESGYTVFNNLEEYQYPFRQNDDGYHFKTQIIFYNDGVKLKMRVNYELFIKGKLAFPANRSVNGHFLIETIPASKIVLKEK
ncbi:hypothetical protein GL982_01330 [Spiroplasma citri]|uniref:Uncharacterized protein n=1 Tax=Spiroplasma citri TaxID=2133 RepID=A0AAJ4ELH2_SPICI|nr:hypothetical protein [Spiroplasma citri]QED25054.1 hypothetical protein FRX96_06595 [Spiroplasma citri]QIA69864.1 hypothetical protein GL298_10575 [Spiroplasma citri]QIA71449.1 hypothetical protein GL981_09075 [Spiroplasma citri]QIA72399.1 hypothetical protein GL982_01330 [Spiroplasma citri]